MTHGIAQLIAGDLDVPDRLPFDLFFVDRQRNRHCAKILGLAKSIQRAVPALIGQLISHFVAIVGIKRACRLKQALFARHIDQFLGHGIGQANRQAQIADHVDILAEYGFQQNIPHHYWRQFHVLKCAWGRRGHNGVGVHIHRYGLCSVSVLLCVRFIGVRRSVRLVK